MLDKLYWVLIKALVEFDTFGTAATRGYKIY